MTGHDRIQKAYGFSPQVRTYNVALLVFHVKTKCICCLDEEFCRTLAAILGSTIRLQMVEKSDAGEGLVEICVVVSDLGRSRYDGRSMAILK
jgi:hypothetical protein